MTPADNLRKLLGRVFSAGTMAEPVVWLDPYHAPASAIEVRLYKELAPGPKPLGDVIMALLEEAVACDITAGFSSPEAGGGALPALRSDLTKQLWQLDGGQIAIETPAIVRRRAINSWQLGLCA
jgi:hypothetical protein